MEENKVATNPIFCKACGKQLSDEDAAAARMKGTTVIVYCCYECYCND